MFKTTNLSKAVNPSSLYPRNNSNPAMGAVCLVSSVSVAVTQLQRFAFPSSFPSLASTLHPSTTSQLSLQSTKANTDPLTAPSSIPLHPCQTPSAQAPSCPSKTSTSRRHSSSYQVPYPANNMDSEFPTAELAARRTRVNNQSRRRLTITTDADVIPSWRCPWLRQAQCGMSVLHYKGLATVEARDILHSHTLPGRIRRSR